MMRKCILGFFLIISVSVCSQTRVQIGDLYYNLSGSTATVTYDRDGTGENSKYTKNSYTIPPSVSYNELIYSVVEIEAGAFSGYNDYWHTGSTASSITIGKNVKNIGHYAFSRCHNLTIVDLAEVETIGNYAFNKCTSLTTITIPTSVTNMGIKTFQNCNLLREIIYLPTSAPINWTAVTKTYVPDLESYSLPSYSMNDAHVIEMITFANNEFAYTGQAPKTTWTNNVEGYTASLTMPVLKADVGSYEEWIPVTFTKGSESFTTNVVYRYTINPIELTVKATNTSREFGDDNPEFTLSYFGFVNGENENVIISAPTVSTTATKTSDVGDYSITISEGEARNYTFVYEPGVLSVIKAPLTAKVKDETRQYGKDNPTFSVSYTGLKNGETEPKWEEALKIETSATRISDVGSYPITATGIPTNYDLPNIKNGTLTVTQAPLTIKANNATKQYYSDNPTFTFTCSGFVNGDNENVLVSPPTLTTTATLTSSAGTYEIKVEETSSPNYSISYVNGTLTITKRTLTASVGNYERVYNEENPAFEVKIEGYVGSEDEDVLKSKPSAYTTATKTSDVGTYRIEVSGGSADNYTFSYTSGTLTINKAEQTISWEQNLRRLKVGDQVELKAVASSGLPITYSMDDRRFAELYSVGDKSYLDCKSSGNFTMRAVQNGNKNYYSSPRASNSVIISGDPYVDFDITLSDVGYATFYDGYYNYSLPSGLKASVITRATGSRLYYTTIAEGEGSILPAGVAVLLEGARRNADTYTLKTIESTATYTGANLLHGSDETTMTYADESNCLFYKLAYGPSGTALSNTFGWFWGENNGRPFTIEGYKAWLAIPQTSAAKSRPLFYSIDGNAIELELVEEIASEEDNGEWYDLQGRRLNVSAGETPALPGVYIRNGKKVLIK